MLVRPSTGALLALALAFWANILFPSDPPPSDPDVGTLSERFGAAIESAAGLSVSSRGALRRDRDTFFWSLFTDKFGSNPNTPYVFES